MPFHAKTCFHLWFDYVFCLAFGDNYLKTNEDTLILSVTKMFARDCSFWRYKVDMDIRYGSCVTRRQWGGRKQPISNAISCFVFQMFENYEKVVAKAHDRIIQHGLQFMSVYYLCGYMRRFFRNDTSNYCGCYSCRLACVRCHVFLLKIPHAT